MSDYITEKFCHKCQTLKPVGQFSRNKTKKDGYATQCKTCCAEYSKEYTREHKDEKKEYDIQYYIDHKEERRQYRGEYYRKNKETSVNKTTQYQREHPIQKAIYRKRYNQTHTAQIRAYNHARRGLENNAEGTHTAQETKNLFYEQRGICFWCDTQLINPFTRDGEGKKAHLDHVIPLVRGGSNWISNLRWTCQFCNHSKGYKLPSEWTGSNGRWKE